MAKLNRKQIIKEIERRSKFYEDDTCLFTYKQLY